ncbi:MAG: site-specific DNA-methyltransferase [Ruminococcus flavefaciens]|nr:site-specific DNA-methyltransferase [Ruminococcus flavefaciens]
MDLVHGVVKEQVFCLEEKELIGNFNDNLLIHGENLQVLKKIYGTYKKSIKCIYIDPPYNTCNEFEYFEDSLSHDDWLAMMKPRLELLWKFLCDEGTIWISIDDEECHYLKVLCDSLWGRDKFLTMIVRQKNDAPRNYKRRKVVHMQDYVLVYSKNIDKCCINEISIEYLKNYFVKDKDQEWVSDSMLKQNSEKDGNRFQYKITTPAGKEIYPPCGRQWSVEADEYQQLLLNNQLWFGKSKNEYPCRKRFVGENSTLPPTSLWTCDMVGSNQEARLEVCAFNNQEFFYVPKPEKFIQLILTIATNEDDIVLDAFLGSGTTAAVAMKMKRRWIGIEKGKQCEEFCLPRLKNVVAGELGGISHDVDWKGGSGFRYLIDIDKEEKESEKKYERNKG